MAGDSRVIPASAEGEDLRATFSGLPARYGNDEITWQLLEEAVPGYTTTISGNAQEGFTVTNTYVHVADGPAPDLLTRTITATKHWEDADNQDGLRAADATVAFELVASHPRALEGIEASVGNIHEGDTVTWDGLPAFVEVSDSNGERFEAVAYTVRESDGVPEGYESVVQAGEEPGHFDVYNIHIPDSTVRLDVTKVWNDAGNADGLRPTSITVELLAGGEATGRRLTLTGAANTWQGAFTGGPRNAYGHPITYSVAEVSNVPGYSSTDVQSGDGQWVITNTHQRGEALAVRMVKTWRDSEGNELEAAPADATFHLVKIVDGLSGRVEGQAKVIPAGATGRDLIAEWTGLPAFENGKPITYTVEEESIAGYNSSRSDGTIADGVLRIDVTNSAIASVEPPTPEQLRKITYLDPRAASGSKILNTHQYPESDVDELAANGEGKPADPRHDGYVFAGWDLNRDEYGDWILVATYNEPNPQKPRLVTYIDGQSATSVLLSEEQGEESVVPPEDPSHDGLQFTGWKESTDSAGNTVYVATYAGIECVPSESPSPSPEPSESPSAEPSVSPSPEPSVSPSPSSEPSESPSAEPSESPAIGKNASESPVGDPSANTSDEGGEDSPSPSPANPAPGPLAAPAAAVQSILANTGARLPLGAALIASLAGAFALALRRKHES